MKVIVIDDEPAMHYIMSRLLGKFPGVEVVGCFEDTVSAVRHMEEHEVHVAYVDISMPRETGIQFAERIAQLHPDLHIVFVTSNDEYALHAFELAALDYIMKPVMPERLEMSVNRARALFHSRETAEEPDANPVRIYALGGLEVQTAHGSVKWISRKSAELFGYLLLHQGRVVSRVRIIADVFGDMPPSNAEKYLNTSVYHLRKALDPHGLKSIVQSDSEGYRLHIVNASIDFIAFEENVKRLAEIESSNLEQALESEAQYVGDLFGERGFGWALSDMERLSALYAAFVKKLAKVLLERHEEETAVRMLNKLFNRNELDEETVELLLYAYAAKKDQASLAKLYRNFVKGLRLELGIDPSKELEAVYARLQASWHAG
ncbi:response regulator [Xylanibacillus composti]|uniref:DNA-binding response regulator n=1 Tax=Xylanibacillus composti TaxID=1572762 RepID=A0A8J4M388_9BACL|nr:response regulator [Xylanibacillus composti]GIQ70650.1 DNA-binding response regulator [Xylanibacillus composti]